MSGWDSVVDQDRDEHRAAAAYDTTKTRRVGQTVVDENDVPAEADL